MEDFSNKKIKSEQNKSNRNSVLPAIIAALITSVVVMTLVIGGLYFAGIIQFHKTELQKQVVVGEGELIADLAERVAPSVVSVRTSRQTVVQGFFGPQERVSEGSGTGIIVSEDGLVLTNKHVIPEDTSKVILTLADDTIYEDVAVLGRDPLNDLAVLKIKNPKNLKPATLGNSDSVRTGTKVIAIGNALGQFKNTVTSGIISGLGRPIEASDGNGSTEQLNNLFQTDAAINPGNSGGPLVNFNGEVIGINTAVAAEAQGVGFAIPINEARPVVESASKTGRVIRPYLGVRYTMLTPEIAKQLSIKQTNGAFIGQSPEDIISGGPADKAGIKSGDIITKVNNISLTVSMPLASAIARYQVGDKVELEFIRNEKTAQVQVILKEAPATAL